MILQNATRNHKSLIDKMILCFLFGRMDIFEWFLIWSSSHSCKRLLSILGKGKIEFYKIILTAVILRKEVTIEYFLRYLCSGGYKIWFLLKKTHLLSYCWKSYRRQFWAVQIHPKTDLVLQSNPFPRPSVTVDCWVHDVFQLAKIPTHQNQPSEKFWILNVLWTKMI